MLQAIFKNILSAPLDLKSDLWARMSPDAKDCVRRMLTRDPRKRLTAEQVLNHPWMRENGAAPDEAFVPEILVRMRQFTKVGQRGGCNSPACALPVSCMLYSAVP